MAQAQKLPGRQGSAARPRKERLFPPWALLWGCGPASPLRPCLGAPAQPCLGAFSGPGPKAVSFPRQQLPVEKGSECCAMPWHQREETHTAALARASAAGVSGPLDVAEKWGRADFGSWALWG